MSCFFQLHRHLLGNVTDEQTDRVNLSLRILLHQYRSKCCAHSQCWHMALKVRKNDQQMVVSAFLKKIIFGGVVGAFTCRGASSRWAGCSDVAGSPQHLEFSCVHCVRYRGRYIESVKKRTPPGHMHGCMCMTYMCVLLPLRMQVISTLGGMVPQQRR